MRILQFFINLLPKILIIQAFALKKNKRFLNTKYPSTLHDYINHLKLLPSDQFMNYMADKISAKLFFQSLKINSKIPILYGIALDANTIIKFENFKYPLIVKTNHDSSGASLAHDDLSLEKIISSDKFVNCARTNYGKINVEPAYENITPTIFFEEFLSNGNSNKFPEDFKIFVVNKKVLFIQVDFNRQSSHTRNFYSPAWKQLKFEWKYSNFDSSITKPRCLSDLIEDAEIIARTSKKDFIRVDFYCINHSPYIGECTFYPESGFGLFRPAIVSQHIYDVIDKRIAFKDFYSMYEV